MAIKDEKELRRIINETNSALQSVQNFLGKSADPRGRIRFPRGFLRTAQEIRSELPKLHSEALRRNIGYALIMADVLNWLLVRTDLSGSAREMVIKEYICILGTVAESLTKDVLKGKISAKAGYKERTKRLLSMGVIDQDNKDDLDWLWDTRNKEHLFLVQHWEYQHYKSKDLERAQSALQSLALSLKKHFG